MIYSGLEFGQYFEVTSDPNCDDIMLAVQPLARLMFTFFQMYFVFLNAKVRTNLINSYKASVYLILVNAVANYQGK